MSSLLAPIPSPNSWIISYCCIFSPIVHFLLHLKSGLHRLLLCFSSIVAPIVLRWVFVVQFFILGFNEFWIFRFGEKIFSDLRMPCSPPPLKQLRTTEEVINYSF